MLKFDPSPPPQKKKKKILSNFPCISGRSEAEGRVESRELGWKRKKWIKKNVPPARQLPDRRPILYPPYFLCKFEEKYYFLKKIS